MKYGWERMAEGVLGGSAYDTLDAIYDSTTTRWLERFELLNTDLRNVVDKVDASVEAKGAFYAYVVNKMPLRTISNAFRIEQTKLSKMMQDVYEKIIDAEKEGYA